MHLYQINVKAENQKEIFTNLEVFFFKLQIQSKDLNKLIYNFKKKPYIYLNAEVKNKEEFFYKHLDFFKNRWIFPMKTTDVVYEIKTY